MLSKIYLWKRLDDVHLYNDHVILKEPMKTIVTKWENY